MSAPDPLVRCSACGTTEPRSEMFGAEPDLVCPSCAQGIRKRMQIRGRPNLMVGKPIVTMTIIGLSAALFLFEHILLKPSSPEWMWRVTKLYMHMGPQIWSGDVSSLWITTFMHGGWMHIFFNMWWCWELGRATEWGFGKLTLILIVLGCGPVAGGVEWMINGPGVGFSGVVYGLAFFLFAHRKTNPLAAAVMNQRTAKFLGMWFVLCIVLTEMGIWNVANWAHGVGGVWGYLVGLATLSKNRKQLVPIAAALTLALIASTSFIAFGRQAEARRVDIKLQERNATRIERWIRYFGVRYTPIETQTDAARAQPRASESEDYLR